MRHEFRLADIGEGLEEAEIISWLCQVGDLVRRDQPLIEVMTDKSNAELPAPRSGTVVELLGSVGDIISVGGLIAVIESDDDSSDRSPEAAESHQHGSAPVSVPAATDTGFDANPPRPKASPSTRREAAARGVDLNEIVGTGPGGRIVLTDLDAAAQVPTPAPTSPTPPPTNPAPAPVTLGTPGTVEPLRGVRRAVAQNMATSWSEIPHIHAFRHIDAAPLLLLRDRLRATERPAYKALTPLSFFVAAVAHALRAHPEANASIDTEAETITYHPSINVGVAVAAPHGLVVPVVRGADQIDFETLSSTLGHVVHESRQGTLAREHFVGGTATITNFGSLGGEQATPLIRPPEAIIIGFGSIADRPFVIDGAVVARKTMHLVAGADHRLLDGDVTTSVLNQIATSLADPLRLVI